MALKAQQMDTVYTKTLQNITASPAKWTDFLACACKNYKCRFDEQVLIYAQCPDATAVLEIEKWNTMFGRWVNRGAKGIAVFCGNHDGKIKYYFDVSDTNGKADRVVPRWRMEARYHDDIIEALENSFGELDDKSDLAYAMLSAADNAVTDNVADYASDVLKYRDSGRLSIMDEDKISAEFTTLVKNSVAFMTLSRCGIDANLHLLPHLFDGTQYFSNPHVINAVGIATSDIAQTCLREIASTVIGLQKSEQNQNRTFANPTNLYDNISKENNFADERGVFDERNNLQHGGRLPNPELSDTNTAADSPWKVRTTASTVPQTAQASAVYQSFDDGEIAGTSDGNRAIGKRENGADNVATGAVARSDGGHEGARPDEMGGADEQHQVASGGDGAGGTNLQLTFLPTIGEQMSLINQAEDEKSSAFAILGQEIDDTTSAPLGTEPHEVLAPTWEDAPRPQLQAFNPHHDIPMAQRHNFKITDENLGEGGAKTKFRHNIDAIKTLQAIEAENRLATPDEQEILSKYVGWGGLSQVFERGNGTWAGEYLELKSLLDQNEYASARESTLNVYYTSPVIIKSIYKAIENMGFSDGNILEPSCGVGNFFGLLPDSMKAAKLYGVELDDLTGRIAALLYQKSTIAVQGYEKTTLPDSFFDVAIGNVPFGNYGVVDKKYDKPKFLIHDYFFAKTLDKVRPGGVVAFITSKGTMDKENPSVRKYIAQRAELIGTIRLPNNAFKANAGTEVTSDIIFLQKRDRIEIGFIWEN